jgi:ABC-type branched-subunit amino acid transport system ATPase component
MDIHNQLVERKPSLARERINYVIEIFPGALPAVEELNALYLKASGGEQRVMTIATVLYSREGKILGFEVK